MKRVWMFLVMCLLAGRALAEVAIRQIDLTGTVSDQELSLNMTFEADVEEAPVRIRVLDGNVSPTEFNLPRKADVVLENGIYYIEFKKNGQQKVSIDFDVQVSPSGQRRAAVFGLPPATVRQMMLETGAEDYQVEVAGAPRAEKMEDGRVKIFLSPAESVRLEWSPELEKLSGALVASCDAVLVGSAKVGALMVQGQFTYSIPQGRMKQLSLALPDDLNVTQVTGEDVLSWKIPDETDGARRLWVELGRPHEKRYVLTVQAEQSLSEFPSSFEFPVMNPQDVIRANGVVLVGTDSTLKLLVDEQGGLTQVEQDAVGWGSLTCPSRGLYAYMFANMPFSLKLTADNIVPSLHVQDQLVLALSENDASLEASVDLEVRDASIREVEIEVPADWTVASVEGQNVADYDVRDRDAARFVKIYFAQAVDRRALLQLRLEKTLAEEVSGFRIPNFRVVDAKSERGFLVLRAETGTRMEGNELEGLREVNTDSLPVRVANARQSFRFKSSEWRGRVGIRQERSSIHAESFHLVSLGESGVFGSCLMTYNIANAPVRSFTVRIPAECRNVELQGRDIRNWTQDGEEWTVHLQQKVIGDYTLLVTYDHPAQYQGEELPAGEIQPLDIENETGFIVLAGAANLSLAEQVSSAGTVLPIDVDEVPEEYALLVNDPIMQAYRFASAPHEARVKIKRLEMHSLLTQVADHTTFETTISKEGEAITVATYHVKNTDRQYLPLRLPEGARLWSVKVDGNKTQVLERGDGEVLVPVERRRDPNAPLKVEVTYAQQVEKPGLRTRMEFKTPDVDTQAVFARWSFHLPEDQHLAAAGGGMEPPAGLTRRQVGWGALTSGFGMLLGAPWVCSLGSAALLVFWAGRRSVARKSVSFGTVMLSLCTLAALLVLALCLMTALFGLSNHSGTTPDEWTFMKSVSGSDGGLQVQLTVVNSTYELLKTGALLLAGLIVPVFALITRRIRLLVLGLAAFVAVCSFSALLAGVTLLLPHFSILLVCFMVGRSRLPVQKFHEPERKMPPYQPEPVELPCPSEGFVQVRMLMALVGLMLLGGLMVRSAYSEDLIPVEETGIVAQWVEIQMEVPEFESEARINASVHMELGITAGKGDTIRLLGPNYVVKDYSLSSPRLRLVSDESGSVVHVERDGEYRLSVDYLSEAVHKNGAWSAGVWMPSSLRNSVDVNLATDGWSVGALNAVRVRQEGTSATILFGSGAGPHAVFWRPEERKTADEQARFFCDVNTLADFRPGMVDLRHDFRFSIAQGELQNLKFKVPEAMNITEVRGDKVSTWRYDPSDGLLEVVLSAPVREAYFLQVGAQVAQEKLPYQVDLQGIEVVGSEMQRGVVAFGAPESVQIDVESTELLSGINTADAARLLKLQAEGVVKRAFRYNQLPFAAVVSATEVQSELRFVESSSFDVSTEQMRLTSRLNVTVGKSGIFALRIQIPEGFDVDALSGDGVSHWDEVIGEPREVVVNFKKQVLGTVSLNLALSRSGRDLGSGFTLPRIRIDGVRKHTGTLVITAERGIRISQTQRDGVSELAPRELGIRQEGSLAYRLLRPDWSVQLASEVMEPILKAEVLQRVALSEGLLKLHCYVNYEIDHAGVKSFRLQSPWPEVDLVVAGRNISRVRKIDEEKGLWEVELHGKVENHYALEVSCQVPFAHGNSELVIEPLKTVAIESQKGYVAVLAGGRLQVSPMELSNSLRSEDARSIPRTFGADDLSDAVLCYRATESDYQLKLNVIRHEAAEVLPAQVRSVRIDSLITRDGQTLNNMVMTLDPGALRFLEMRLPEGAEIWSVFMNETAERPLVENGLFLIPIEPGADRSTTVEVMYARKSLDDHPERTLRFSGPQFKLPLRDVVWTFYAPEGYHYSRFDGSMVHQEEEQDWGRMTSSFSADEYISYNSENARISGDNARWNMDEANDYMEVGDQVNARKAFQKAIAYSEGQQDVNEDARVQYRTLVRQQGVAGLVNRRNQLKQSLNQQVDVQQGNAGMQISSAELQQLEARLGEKESNALGDLAARIFDQQQAAAVEVHPIRVVMARQGARIEFDRTLQLQSDTAMEVEFKVTPIRGSRGGQWIVALISCGVVLLSGFLMLRLRRIA